MRIRKSAEDRKAEIQQIALELVFEAGPELVTTGMIAGRLGLTQPAIYKHFSSKEEIWQAIAVDLCNQITANITRAISEATSPCDKLRRLILGHLQLIHQFPALPEIMVARSPNGERSAVQIEIQKRMTEFSKVVRGLVLEAQQSGIFRSDIEARDIALLLMGVVQSFVLRLLVTRDPSVLVGDPERLLDLQLSNFARVGEIV